MIKIQITIKYNNREVSILPGYPASGRIIKSGNEFITDRISNAENFNISIADNSNSITTEKYTFILSYRDNSHRETLYIYKEKIKLPFKRMSRLISNSHYDSVCIELISMSNESEKYIMRIPIGSRS